MHNAWRVFTRDWRRVARVPKAWIVIIGITIVPSLYAWLNIVAFWDPYSNTGNIDVAIVNLDHGSSSEPTGPINIGNQVVDQLKDNHQLGWQFMDEQAALDSVRGGQSFAAIIIPADFSADLLSITSGNFVKPKLQYFVNEKVNAISPKLTDVGASTLEQQITSSFSSEVAEAATEALQSSGIDAESKLDAAQSGAVNAVEEAVRKVGVARTGISGVRGRIEDSRDRLSAAGESFAVIDSALEEARTAVSQAQSIMGEVQTGVTTFTDSVSSAYVDSAVLLAGVSAQANTSVSALIQGLEEANLRVGIAITDLQGVIASNGEALKQLQALVDQGDLDPAVSAKLAAAVAELEARNAADQETLEQLQGLNSSLSEVTASLQGTADGFNDAVQNSSAAAGQIREVLVDSVPALNQAMSALTMSAEGFSAALGAQQGVLVEAGELLTDLDGQLASTSEALVALDSNLVELETGLGNTRTDLLALGSAALVQNLNELSGLEPAQIAEFMASPVEVRTNVLYPIDNYGSAMAALFTNLTLWIGAFMLMVVFKLEVDKEGIHRLSVRQAYWGRWLFLAVLAAFQGLVVGVGDLIIGVQHTNAVVFVLTTTVIAICYLSIIYALSVSFGYVGKGLCVVLVIMQIPGASGIYPIEMMPGFFRFLYPFFPFTYGIDALREVIAGFYGNHYWRDLGTLAGFVVLSFILGLFLRQRLANLNRLFNLEVAATGLYVSEDVQPARGGYRLAQVVQALTGQPGSGAHSSSRSASFLRLYPRLRRGTLLLGLAGVLVLALLSILLPSGKVTLLALWGAWLLVVIVSLVIIEYLRHSFEEANRLATMSEADLRLALADSGTDPEVPEPTRIGGGELR